MTIMCKGEVKLVDSLLINSLLLLAKHAELFSEIKSKVTFISAVIESTNLTLITPLFVTGNKLILFRMVKTFNHSVAFIALQTSRTLFPSIVTKNLTVFSTISK
jgi:hypothetical protein